jgi:hypothetical protein
MTSDAGNAGSSESSGEEPGEEPRGVGTRGLGDMAGEFFASLGITEERYKSVKVALHLDPKCNCADRRRWLNEMGQQLGVDGVVMKMARWMDRGKGS